MEDASEDLSWVNRPETKELMGLFEKIFDLSKWLLALGLATLGLFFTALLQVRLNYKDSFPHGWIAGLSLMFLLISIVAGVVIRGKFLFNTWSLKFSRIPHLDEIFYMSRKKGSGRERIDEMRARLTLVESWLERKRQKIFNSLNCELLTQVTGYLVGLLLLISYFWSFLFL